MPPWLPVLEGADAARARAAALEVAVALGGMRCEGVSLAEGKAGVALALGELASLLGEPRLGEEARAALGEAVRRMQTAGLGPGLWDGFTGVAWAAHRLAEQGDGEIGLEEVDAILADALPSWVHGLDVLSGLAGVAAYLSERRSPALSICVDQLERAAEPAFAGVLWRTPAEELPAPERAEFPGGCLYLGVAHGTCGIAAALARIAAAGVEVKRCSALARAAARSVLAERPHGPAAVAGAPGPARGSWCHGVPGMVASLLLVARQFEDRALHDELVPLAREAAARPLPDVGVDDHGGLCHGAASALHLRVRLFGHTRDWSVRAAAARCAAHALSVGPPPEPGLLAGAAGWALALASAAADRPPDWDRPLLLG